MADQIDYQGSGRQSGGTYAYLDPEFHTNKKMFVGDETATKIVKQESFDLVESGNSSSSNQVPVKEEDISAANAAPKESKRRSWADEQDWQWHHNEEFDHDDDGHWNQKETKW